VNRFPRVPINALIQNSRAQAATVDDEKVWSLNLDQIESGSGRVLKKYMVPLKDLGPSTYRFDDGTLLYSKLRPYLNKVVVADAPGYATTELVALRCDPAKMVPSFLAHYLRSPEFLGFANTVVAGAKMPRMVMSAFWRYAVPAPSLDDQHRIAAILDQADALRAKRREALAQLDCLTQSIFMEMFGDPVANSKEWMTHKLGDLVSKLGSGSTPTGGDAAYKASGISLIRSLNVHDASFVYKNLAFIDEVQAAKLRNVVVEENDVLLNITGASVARVCRAPRDVLPARVNQHVMILRPKSDLSAIFLEHLLLCPQMKTHLLKVGGAGATREAITKADAQDLDLIVPPKSLQLEFEQRVRFVLTLKKQSEMALTELDALFASLQHRAFQGAL